MIRAGDLVRSEMCVACAKESMRDCTGVFLFLSLIGDFRLRIFVLGTFGSFGCIYVDRFYFV